jgi:NADH-quinone oxidoreductase subunit K
MKKKKGEKKVKGLKHLNSTFKLVVFNYVHIKYIIKNFMYFQIIISLFIFVSTILSIIFKQSNVLVIIMCLELLLLNINYGFVLVSFFQDNFTGHLFSLLILTIAASEAAVGLAILIAYFKIRGNIDVISNQIYLKG